MYLPAEGKTLKNNWDDLKDLTVDILNKFRQNATLNCQTWGSIISAGNTIIDATSQGEGKKTKWIGHVFNLQATKTEN